MQLLNEAILSIVKSCLYKAIACLTSSKVEHILELIKCFISAKSISIGFKSGEFEGD
jgi:hypothetical protein